MRGRNGSRSGKCSGKTKFESREVGWLREKVGWKRQC